MNFTKAVFIFVLGSLVVGNGLVTILIPHAIAQVIPPPVLADPEKFSIELCADLKPFGRLKAFQLTFTDGENGFGQGLYVTSGPAANHR